MSPDTLAAKQAKPIERNVITNWLLGRAAVGVSVSDGTATGAAGMIPTRIYEPLKPEPDGPEALPAVVYFHGGGWALGHPSENDWLCSNVAAEVGAVVISVAYRLAPDHAWPAAPEDCYAALLDIIGRAEALNIDPRKIAVMGDSAGGNLAAVVCLMARDRSGPPILHQSLIYPATDLTWSSPSIDEHASAPILTKADLEAYRDHYLGSCDPREPYVSPLHAPSHAGLPPALIQVAEYDPLRGDGERYADALAAAGVLVQLTSYEGMPHGYFSFPPICHSTPQALAELCAEQVKALAELA